MHLVLRSLVIALSTAIVACSGSSNSDDTPPLTQNPPSAVSLTFLSRYSTGQFGVNAVASVAYYGGNRTAFIANRHRNLVEVVSLTNPAAPTQLATIDASAAAAAALGRPMGSVSSVATYDDPIATNDRDRIAVTVYGQDMVANGAVVVYKAADRSLVTVLQTGVGPKSAAFSQDGRFIVTADEGAPAPDYSVDPEASVSVVDLTPTPVAPATTAPPAITVLDFRAFNVTGITPIPTTSRESEVQADVRFTGRAGATRAIDFDPQSVSTAVNARAYVSLQENNALATVALSPARIESIVGLGSKDFNTATSTLDASDQDGGGALTARPVRGLRQPGVLVAYRNADEVLLLTANTGAPRQRPGFTDATRAATLNLDTTVFPTAATLQQDANIGRLVVSTLDGNAAATTTPAPGVPQDPDIETIFAFGARSFSIVRTTGFPIFDSGNDFERITLQRLTTNFNSAADANGTGDTRSDDQGPAPKAVAIGQIDGSAFAFFGLSEVGGIMVYAMDTGLRSARFLEYKNDRNYTVGVSNADGNADGAPDSNPEAGDLGPTQMIFVPVSASPTADSLLIVGNAVSGTASIYAVRPVTP
jgi:hypothetical protein